MVVIGGDRSGVDAVVRDELGKRFLRSAKNKVVKLDYGECSYDSRVRADMERHLAFDREIRIGAVRKRVSRTTELIFEEAGMDRAAHPELCDHAGVDASDLVTGNGIAFGATQARQLCLHIVSFCE